MLFSESVSPSRRASPSSSSRLGKGTNTLSGAVKQYEGKMFERAEEFGKESAANLILFFEEDALTINIVKTRDSCSRKKLSYPE